ncbi:MAG TPA: hypothetical protein GXX37_10080 [Clostridiaceae bacterium]|nr:hypothetical protein [Clostridiaceae bacterium]
MRLFYQEPKTDYKKVHEVVSKGYGDQHPEKIHGYEGAFLFTLLDVYVSDRLEQLLESRPEIASTLHELLKKFKKDEYCDLSPSEVITNIEQRYFGGSHQYMIARYNTDIGIIIFESFYDMSLLYFDGEDISDIREAQKIKSITK